MAEEFPGEGRQGPAVNPTRANKKRQRQVDDKNVRDLVLRTLMGEANGRRFLWNFLGDCNVFRQTVVFGAGGHAATAFNEGKRTLGLMMLADITRLDPAGYMKMTVENSAVELEDDDNG